MLPVLHKQEDNSEQDKRCLYHCNVVGSLFHGEAGIAGESSGYCWFSCSHIITSSFCCNNDFISPAASVCSSAKRINGNVFGRDTSSVSYVQSECLSIKLFAVLAAELHGQSFGVSLIIWNLICALNATPETSSTLNVIVGVAHFSV